MTSEKKTTLLRILIFLLLSFTPPYLFMLLSPDDGIFISSAFGATTVMFYPVIANLLTRLITKEGMGESFLRINLRGHGREYALSLLYPVLIGLIGGVVLALMYTKNYSLAAAIESNGGGDDIAASFLYALFIGAGEVFLGFGEEFGWRAYLTPKLEKLMPTFPAVCVTGIIWGLWHAPLVARGYDWGTDYPFFPFLGIISMCAACIMLSAFLTYLTKRTGSVYPAAICHTFIDVIMTLCVLMVTGDTGILENHTYMSSLVVMFIIPAVFALPCFVYLCRKKPLPEKA